MLGVYITVSLPRNITRPNTINSALTLALHRCAYHPPCTSASPSTVVPHPPHAMKLFVSSKTLLTWRATVRSIRVYCIQLFWPTLTFPILDSAKQNIFELGRETPHGYKNHGTVLPSVLPPPLRQQLSRAIIAPLHPLSRPCYHLRRNMRRRVEILRYHTTPVNAQNNRSRAAVLF